MMKIELILGIPENGWLPVEFISDQLKISFTSSNIPTDPTDQLCESLILILKGLKSKMTWNLEPAKIDFEFISEGEIIHFIITQNGKVVQKLTGNFNSILLPIYRSLNKFSSLEYEEHNWKMIDHAKLKKLNSMVAMRKTNHNY